MLGIKTDVSMKGILKCHYFIQKYFCSDCQGQQKTKAHSSAE